MNKTNLFRKMFWLLLAIGVSTAVFTSCGEEETPPPANSTENPNEPGNPDNPNNPIAVSSVSLNKTVLTLAIGESETLEATVLPDEIADETVIWSSNNANATVDETGKITSVAEGTAIITAKAGDRQAACTVTVRGVKINGVIWATRNVDAPGTFAATPESSGCFYQWNRKTAWAAAGYITDWDSSEPSGTEWTAANDPSPDGWRVPTEEELKTLLDTDKVSSEWTNQNGVNGRKFTDIATNNSLFLPAVGDRYGNYGALGDVGSIGIYWSSTRSFTDLASYLYFTSDYANYSYFGGANGQSVRCVAE